LKYQWGFRYLFIIIIKLNKTNLQILLQDKYNIGVLTVNIEFMWLGTKRVERLAKAHSFPRF
jgi:ribosomal protein L23